MGLLRRIALHWLVLAAALAVTALVVPSVEIEGGPVSLLLAALVLGLVNALLGPVLRLVSAPITLLTLGLFSVVVNAVLLAVAAALSDNLSVGGPLGWLVGAVVLAVVNAVLGRAFLGSDD